MSTWSKASRKQEGRFSGSWLANRLWVSLDVRPYLLLFGDTMIRPPFSFWWFISICSGPQAENSTLKVKKVGYYPTIDYISPERKFYEEFKYAVELLIGSKGEWDMDLAKINFCGPQNPNIFSHKILVPDPISYWMPYLNSSWNFLSENVYFLYGRAKISQVKLSWSSRGAKFSESGDVTLRVASSKRMAVSILG